MSYIRMGDEGSEVYVLGGAVGQYHCSACALLNGPVVFDSAQKMIDHLLKHREAGHVVPDSTFPRLVAEALQQKQTVP